MIQHSIASKHYVGIKVSGMSSLSSASTARHFLKVLGPKLAFLHFLYNVEPNCYTCQSSCTTSRICCYSTFHSPCRTSCSQHKKYVCLQVGKEAPCWTNLAFFTSPARFDSLAEAQEQIKKGTEYLNQGSLDMAMHSYHKSVQIAPSGKDGFIVYANACWHGTISQLLVTSTLVFATFKWVSYLTYDWIHVI